MKTNDAGRNLIKRWESLRLDAYRCPAGVPTIGYGHTGDVKMGDKITAHQADAILDLDLYKFEQGVERLCPGINENQFAALVSFAFNLGLGALAMSGLRTHLMAGRLDAAAKEFGKWCHASVKGRMIVLAGLVARREDEALLFSTPPAPVTSA